MRSGHRLQPRHGGLGPVFLVEAEGCVEQEDQGDGDGFDRPDLRTFGEPDTQIKGEREQQDVDQRTLVLTYEPAPERIARGFR